MATKLVMDFNDADGATRKWSFNYADPDIEANDVKALMNGMITNGSIFAYPPVKIAGARLVVTTETNLDVKN